MYIIFGFSSQLEVVQMVVNFFINNYLDVLIMLSAPLKICSDEYMIGIVLNA